MNTNPNEHDADVAGDNAEEPIFSFGVFTDAHYAEMTYGDRCCADSLDKIRAAIDTFNTRGLRMAINLGDSVDKGDDKDTVIGYLDAVRAACREFNGELHTVLGNHDVVDLAKQDYYGHCGATNARPFYSFDQAGIHFVLLDGNSHEDGSDFNAGDFSWTETWLSEAQLIWLAEDLTTAGDQPTIVCCHENLDHRLREGDLDPHVLRNAAAVRAILHQSGDVCAVLQGHYHRGLQTIIDGIPCITPTAMVIGPGLESNAFGIMSVYADQSILFEGFGRQESYQIKPL